MLIPCATCGRLSWQCKRCRLLIQNVPPEVWIEIFGHLDAPNLLNLRLTCRTWKQLVDESPSLRRRLKVRIVGAEITLDQDYGTAWLPPATQILIHVDRMESVDSWWSAFGPRLVVLELVDNYVPLGTLFGMLSQTPLLKELVLIDNYILGDAVDVNFRLDYLEKLVLTACDKGAKAILELFCEICPRLKYLSLCKHCDQELALKLVVAAQNTLKGLKLHATNGMLEAMSKLKNLQLRYVSLFSSANNDPQIFGKFLRTQRNIDDLCIHQENFQILRDFGHHLVRLTLHLKKEHTISIGQMPTLKYLEIIGPYRRFKVQFTDCFTSNLEEFRLDNILIADKILFNNLLNCSKLHLLAIAIAMTKTVNLAELSQNFNSLKTLKIKGSNTTRTQLMDLFRCCPKLENLELKSVKKINSEIVQFLCLKLAHLKRLALSCRLGDSSASAIIRYHGPALRQLHFVDDGWNLTEETKRKLQAHFSPWCSVQFCLVGDAELYLRDLVRF